MTEHRVRRRLAAILAADVVGHSRLMGENEAGTLAQLKNCRTEVIDPSLARYGGRIVKVMGDGVLVEFSSAVDAVQSALDVQMAMAKRNDDVPPVHRMAFRVGVHLGDVIVDGDDIYGDGVNVVARLEGLSEAGSICVSDDVYRQVRGKVEATFDDLGPQQVKNIVEPVRTFRVSIESKSRVARSGAGGTLVPPDKPSLTVLPFVNMSGDAEQEYFADGMTEDIITSLSKLSQLMVIARNSSFTYKGRAVRVQQVGQELGVAYAIEGSVAYWTPCAGRPPAHNKNSHQRSRAAATRSCGRYRSTDRRGSTSAARSTPMACRLTICRRGNTRSPSQRRPRCMRR